MEAKRLGGDLADAGEFALRRLDVSPRSPPAVAGQGDQVEKVGDGLERVVDLVRDGAGEAADGGELFALNESALRLLLMRDLEDDGGDRLDFAFGTIDRGVIDVPEALLARAGGKFAFKNVVPDSIARRHLLKQLFQPCERSDFGNGAAKDLVFRKADHRSLVVVHAQVAELDGIEQREADRSGIVDGFELGALAFRLDLLLQQRLSEGLAVVDVDGDAKPVENSSGRVPNRLGADPPPAGSAVAAANHARFDIVFGPGGDGVRPGLEDVLAIVGMEGRNPVVEVVHGEAEIVDEAVVGIGDVAAAIAHPDGLGIEIGQNAVAGFAGGERDGGESSARGCRWRRQAMTRWCHPGHERECCG